MTVITIVGFGNIGKLICALLLQKKEHHFSINILDVDPNVIGAITDLKHGNQLYSNHSISFNDDDLFNNSDFIFHCAGESVPKGKSRLVTCEKSVDITEAIFQNFEPVKKPFIIVLANPVDVIATITYKITGLPQNYIIGTGTLLDSIRMNHIIAERNKGLNSVDSVLLGEHGESAFLSDELSSINGIKFSEFFDDTTLDVYMDLMKGAAKEIKSTQDATMYGVSYCAIHIFELLFSQKGEKIPVSALIPERLKKDLGNENVFVSLYSNVNEKGAIPSEDYEPNPSELKLLKKSYEVILSCIPSRYL